MVNPNDLYHKTSKVVDTITDNLGMPVDQGIKETVISLIALSLPTTASCEGHLNNESLPYPWIDISVEDEDTSNSESGIRRRNLLLQRDVIVLLAKFYETRNSPFESRLTFRNIGAFGAFRLQSIGAEITELLTSAVKKRKLLLFQDEMFEFGRFLHSKITT